MYVRHEMSKGFVALMIRLRVEKVELDFCLSAFVMRMFLKNMKNCLDLETDQNIDFFDFIHNIETQTQLEPLPQHYQGNDPTMCVYTTENLWRAQFIAMHILVGVRLVSTCVLCNKTMTLFFVRFHHHHLRRDIEDFR